MGACMQVLLDEGYGVDQLGRLCLHVHDPPLVWAKCVPCSTQRPWRSAHAVQALIMSLCLNWNMLPRSSHKRD